MLFFLFVYYLVPRETCTVNELLDQIGVPYERDTDIQCYAKPGMNIDFLVTVGVNINEIPRDIVSAAENTMNMKQQEQQQRQPIQQNQVTVTPNTIRTVQKSMVVQVPKVQSAVHIPIQMLHALVKSRTNCMTFSSPNLEGKCGRYT